MNDLIDLARAACDAWTRGGATHADLSAAMHDLHAAVATRKVAVQLADDRDCRQVAVTTSASAMLPSGPLPLPVVSQAGARITVMVPPGADVLIRLQTLPMTRVAERLPFDRDGKPREVADE